MKLRITWHEVRRAVALLQNVLGGAVHLAPIWSVVRTARVKQKLRRLDALPVGFRQTLRLQKKKQMFHKAVLKFFVLFVFLSQRKQHHFAAMLMGRSCVQDEDDDDNNGDDSNVNPSGRSRPSFSRGPKPKAMTLVQIPPKRKTRNAW